MIGYENSDVHEAGIAIEDFYEKFDLGTEKYVQRFDIYIS